MNYTKEKAGLWKNLPTIRHVRSEAENSFLINTETKTEVLSFINILDNEADIINAPHIFKWALCEIEMIKIPVFVDAKL